MILHEEKNLLPEDGQLNYYGVVFSGNESDDYLNKLLDNIEWKNDEIKLFGKIITTKRKVAWYGDFPFEYRYSNRTKLALLWTNELLELKHKVEYLLGETFNSCLLNLYHNGSEGMAWHSDNEKELKKHGAIASLSFGAERKFVLKHNFSGEKVELFLENGSLLIIKNETQDFWLHRLTTTKRILTPRINLTFRTIIL